MYTKGLKQLATSCILEEFTAGVGEGIYVCLATHLIESQSGLLMALQTIPCSSHLSLPISSFFLFFLFPVLSLPSKTEFQCWTYFMSILNINDFLVRNKNTALSLSVKLISGQVSMFIWAVGRANVHLFLIQSALMFSEILVQKKNTSVY